MLFFQTMEKKLNSTWKIYEILIEIKRIFRTSRKKNCAIFHTKNSSFHFERKSTLRHCIHIIKVHLAQNVAPKRCILHVHLINTTRKTLDFLSLSLSRTKDMKTLSIWYIWNCCCIVLNNILWNFLVLRSFASVAMVSLSCAPFSLPSDSCTLY